MNKAAEHWDREAAEHATAVLRLWLAHPKIQARLNRLVSGDEAVDPYRWFLHWLKQNGVAIPVRSLVSVGCGVGELDRIFVDLGLADDILGLDVSPRSIEIARSMASEKNRANLHYQIVDLNEYRFAPQSCDIIIASMAVHHIENLEHFFAGAREALRPHPGFLMLNEFIGPMRFQWTPVQLEMINRLLEAIPRPLRRMTDGNFLDVVRKPFLSEMLAADPSESIRSNEIMIVLKDYFDIVEYRPWRGGLLHMLISDIVGNFIGDVVREGYISLLGVVEDILTETKVLSDDFAVIVAKPKQ
jgi:2-polyprenyl-3-methyl-5-hydroxy-6-metoxy-1,4-benzoquinol methylase